MPCGPISRLTLCVTCSTMDGMPIPVAEPDVRPAEDGAKGYNAAALQHTAGQFKLHEDLKKYLYDKGLGAAKWEETGEILYVRGLINAMLGVEAIGLLEERECLAPHPAGKIARSCGTKPKPLRTVR